MSDQDEKGAEAPDHDDRPVRGLNRRRLLGRAGLLGLGATAGAVASAVINSPSTADVRRAAVQTPRAFHGPHQPGVIDPAPAHLIFAAYDLPAAAPPGRGTCCETC